MTVLVTPQKLPFRSANELWADRVTKSGAGLAFRHKQAGAWVDVSWTDADAHARELAAGLAALGLKAGDRIAVVSQTRYEWMLCDIAILLAGGATVPIYPSLPAEQATYIMRDCGARAAIVEDAAQLEKLLPLLLTGVDLHLVTIGGDAPLERTDAKGRTKVALADVLASVPREAARRITDLEELRKTGRQWLSKPENAQTLEARAKAPGPDDLFTIIYTSGTTGNPKGVVLTHENIIASFASGTRALTLLPSDVQYLWLTLAHVLGREMAWAPIFVGSSIAFTEGLLKIKDNLLEIRPTFMAGVPRVYEKFYTAVQAGMKQGSGLKRALVSWAMGVGRAHAQLRRQGKAPGSWLAFQHGLADKLVFSKLRAKLGLDRCRFLISGGAPLAAEIAEFFHAVGLLVLEGYGLTETTSATHVNRLEKYRFGTVGPAIDAIEQQIAEDGEILVRGPSVFKQYFNNATATAEAIDADGWFHTGDIGELDADGFLRITDRKKDLIVLAGGKKVAPQVLENGLKTRAPLVSQALVYGDKRPYCVALITLTEDAAKKYGEGDVAKAASHPEVQSTIKQAVDGLNGTLANFESIKRFKVLSEDFTEANGQLTPSLKVKRKVAIDRHRKVLDGLYAGGGD